eukprot:357645-Chlamydomonas_euryale.AAC.2
MRHRPHLPHLEAPATLLHERNACRMRSACVPRSKEHTAQDRPPAPVTAQGNAHLEALAVALHQRNECRDRRALAKPHKSVKRAVLPHETFDKRQGGVQPLIGPLAIAAAGDFATARLDCVPPLVKRRLEKLQSGSQRSAARFEQDVKSKCPRKKEGKEGRCRKKQEGGEGTPKHEKTGEIDGRSNHGTGGRQHRPGPGRCLPQRMQCPSETPSQSPRACAPAAPASRCARMRLQELNFARNQYGAATSVEPQPVWSCNQCGAATSVEPRPVLSRGQPPLLNCTRVVSPAAGCSLVALQTHVLTEPGAAGPNLVPVVWGKPSPF